MTVYWTCSPHPHLPIHGTEVGGGNSTGTGTLVGKSAIGIGVAFSVMYGEQFVCLSPLQTELLEGRSQFSPDLARSGSRWLKEDEYMHG